MRRDVDPTGPDSAPTIGAVIARWAARHPDRTAFTLLGDGESVTTVLSYGELAQAYPRAARALRARNLAGERVLLVHPQGTEFIKAFLAVLEAGAVAEPAPSAAPGRANRARLTSIAHDARPALIVTTSDLRDEAKEIIPGPP